MESGIKPRIRCDWSFGDPLLVEYHDKEWGVPVHEDKLLFEFLILEGAQAGLSWLMVLKKRESYRKAFDQFNPEKIAAYDERKIMQILQDEKIIRNKLKVRSAVQNAKSLLTIKREFGSFDNYIWGFMIENRPKENRWSRVSQIPPTSPESDAMSRDLKKRGFKFVGSTICYSFMQATGMVNDHKKSCFRYAEIIAAR